MFRYDIQGRKHVQSVIHSTLYILEVKALVLLSPKIFNYLVSYISAGGDFSRGDHLKYLPRQGNQLLIACRLLLTFRSRCVSATGSMDMRMS